MDLSTILSGPPPGVIPNFINPTTLGDAIIAVSATSSFLACIFLCIRLYSTTRITCSVGSDDYTLIIAFILSLAYASCIVHTRDHARHVWDISLADYNASYFQIIFAETIVGALGLLFAKLSILILLSRIFSPNRKLRYAIYFGMLWTGLISATSILLAGIFCAPRIGESFGSLTVALRCTKNQTWAVVQGVLSTVLDFYIFCLPLPIVWKLHLEPKKKVGILVIFMTGLNACIASLLGLYYKVKLFEGRDILWNSYKVDMLNIVEMMIAIMVASMPACASFTRHFSTKYSLGSYIRSRISRSKPSTNPSDQSTEKRSEFHTPSDDNPSKESNSRYWRLRNPFGRGNAPPQITMVKGRDRVLQTGEFDIVLNKVTSEHRVVFYEEDGKVHSPHDMV